MPLTILDIVLLAIMFLSGFLAMMRGVTREVLSIASWGFASISAYFAYSRFKEAVRAEITPNLLADAVLIGGVFLLVLLIISFITSRISDMILDSSIGPLDRSLGFVFGLARGLLIMVVAHMFFTYLVSDERGHPRWLKEAKSRDLLMATGDWVRSKLPEDPEAALQKLRKPTSENEPVREGDVPVNKPDAPSYRPSDRSNLNQLLQNTQQPSR